MKKVTFIFLFLGVFNSNSKDLHADLCVSNKVEKPLGLVNSDGVCYANATLEALFHLEDFNEFLLANKKVIKKRKHLLGLDSYLKALRIYRKNIANPIFYSFIKGGYIPCVKLPSYEGIVNDQNEPTEIIQKILLDIQVFSPHADRLLNLLPPLNLKEIIVNKNVKATAKILLQTSTSKYVFVLIDNPLSEKLYELIDNNSKPDGDLLLPIVIKTNQFQTYELASIVSSSKLSHNLSSDLGGDSLEETQHGPNHSTAYANIGGQWFYFNDQEVSEVSTQHIRSFLKGEPSLILGENTVVEQFAPGILIYEQKYF